LGPPESTTQTASRLVSCFCTAHGRQSLYCYNRPTIPPLYGGSGRHLIHGCFSPPKPTTQTASRSVQWFFRAHDRDRQTNRPQYSVTISRIYACRTVMRPNKQSFVIKLLSPACKKCKSQVVKQYCSLPATNFAVNSYTVVVVAPFIRLKFYSTAHRQTRNQSRL